MADSWKDKAWVKAIPNYITYFRFAIVPLFVFLLVNPTPNGRILATVIFMFASFSDWLDGYLARLFGAESAVGKLLDPLADKVLVMSALVMLAAVPTSTSVPAWMVVVMLTREMVVTGLRSLSANNGLIVEASRWAKHKTAWTMLAIVFLLVDEPYETLGILIDYNFCGMVFLWISVFFTLFTGLDYIVKLRGCLVKGAK